MRRVKRAARSAQRGLVRTIGGTIAAFLATLFLLGNIDPHHALFISLPIAFSGGLLALLWPVAFPRRRRW